MTRDVCDVVTRADLCDQSVWWRCCVPGVVPRATCRVSSARVLTSMSLGGTGELHCWAGHWCLSVITGSLWLVFTGALSWPYCHYSHCAGSAPSLTGRPAPARHQWTPRILASRQAASHHHHQPPSPSLSSSSLDLKRTPSRSMKTRPLESVSRLATCLFSFKRL